MTRPTSLSTPVIHHEHFQTTIPFLGRAAGFEIRPGLKAPLGNLFYRLMHFKYH